MFGFVLAFAFAIFTAWMIKEQVDVLTTNTSKIEYKQGTQFTKVFVLICNYLEIFHV